MLSNSVCIHVQPLHTCLLNICVCIHAQPLHTIQFAPNPTDLRAKQEACEANWWAEELSREVALEKAEIYEAMLKAWDLADDWWAEEARTREHREHMAAKHLPLFPSTNAEFLARTGGAGSCTDNSSPAASGSGWPSRKRARMGTSASRAQHLWERGAATK